LGDFVAPSPADLVEFTRTRLGLDLAEVWKP
jgi:hypothetical protein